MYKLILCLLFVTTMVAALDEETGSTFGNDEVDIGVSKAPVDKPNDDKQVDEPLNDKKLAVPDEKGHHDKHKSPQPKYGVPGEDKTSLDDNNKDLDTFDYKKFEKPVPASGAGEHVPKDVDLGKDFKRVSIKNDKDSNKDNEGYDSYQGNQDDFGGNNPNEKDFGKKPDEKYNEYPPNKNTHGKVPVDDKPLDEGKKDQDQYDNNPYDGNDGGDGKKYQDKYPDDGYDKKPTGVDGGNKYPGTGHDGKLPPGGYDGKVPEGSYDGKLPQSGNDGKLHPGGYDGKVPEGSYDGKLPQGNDYDYNPGNDEKKPTNVVPEGGHGKYDVKHKEIANQIIDKLLDLMKRDYRAEFDKVALTEVGPIKHGRWGSVILRDGFVTGLTNVHRTGDALVVDEFGGKKLIVADITLRDVNADYKVDAKLFHRISIKNRKLLLSLRKAVLNVRLIADKTSEKLVVKDVVLKHKEGFAVKSGRLVWPFNKLTDSIVKSQEHVVMDIVKQEVAKYMGKVVQGIPFDQVFGKLF